LQRQVKQYFDTRASVFTRQAARSTQENCSAVTWLSWNTEIYVVFCGTVHHCSVELSPLRNPPSALQPQYTRYNTRNIIFPIVLTEDLSIAEWVQFRLPS